MQFSAWYVGPVGESWRTKRAGVPCSEVSLLYSVQTMPSRKRQRPTHKRRPTPKGEAGTALEHAEACLHELQTISRPNQRELFVRRLNDFLAAARRVSEFLSKETGRAPGLSSWIRQEHDNLIGSDPRYAYFCALRTISIHDSIVQPDRAQHSVEITASLRVSGHFEAEVRDPETGRPAGRVIYDGPVGAESVHEETRVRTKYFFADRPNEDIVTFCNEVLVTLRGLVSKAYQLFP